jgi:hypothetical protein
MKPAGEGRSKKRRTMAKENHTRAFVFGALLGGAAAAAFAVWNAPVPGARLRSAIATELENGLFRLMRMEQQVGQPEIRAGSTASSPVADRVAPDEGGTDIVIDGPRPVELAG